jgi:hypothetical protein
MTLSIMDYLPITLQKAIEIRPDFVPDSREGPRCGYYCPACPKVYTVDEGNAHLRWNMGGQFAEGICSCSGGVTSIEEKA